MGCTFVRLHVLPHIRKYLLVRLSTSERLADPSTQELVTLLSNELRQPILHAKLDEVLQTAPRSKLELAVEAEGAPTLSRRSILAFNSTVEKRYRQHAHAWMDWYIATFRVQIITGLQAWRQRYGITEEDLPLETSRMAYVRYRKKRNDMLPHGGARRTGGKKARARIVI